MLLTQRLKARAVLREPERRRRTQGVGVAVIFHIGMVLAWSGDKFKGATQAKISAQCSDLRIQGASSRRLARNRQLVFCSASHGHRSCWAGRFGSGSTGPPVIALLGRWSHRRVRHPSGPNDQSPKALIAHRATKIGTAVPALKNGNEEPRCGLDA